MSRLRSLTPAGGPFTLALVTITVFGFATTVTMLGPLLLAIGREFTVPVGTADPEPQYGWVEIGARLARVGGEPVWRVRGFTEKPSVEAARVALARGDLWNTFVMVATAATLLELGWRALPALSARLAAIAPVMDTEHQRAALEHAYIEAPAASFSRAILERHPSALAVSRLPPSISWSDWGTPERVITSLRAAGLVPAWLRALDRHAAALA